MKLFPRSFWFGLAFVLLIVESTMGQVTNVTTPFQSFGDSGFSSTGVHFGWGGGNVVPQFGGYDPGSGGSLNVNAPGFHFGLNFAQGSTRSSVTNAPSLTVMNGFGGSIFSGQIRPFVTGVIPIVGDQGVAMPPPIDNAVTRALESGQLDLRPRSQLPRENESSGVQQSGGSDVLYGDENSSATRGDLSVAAIKAERARQVSLRNRALATVLKEAEQWVSSAEPGKARSAYREALKLTDDAEMRKNINARIAATRTAKK